MKYNRMGKTGLKVSEICLGSMTFGDQADLNESRRIVDVSAEAGVNFIDTADVYTGGKSEEFVGTILEGRRKNFIVATKLFGAVGPGVNDRGSSRSHIMNAIENSLRKLKTDYVDIYQVHRWDPETPIEETLGALDDLVHSGKVRYLGCSNFAAWQLMKSLWASDKSGVARFDCTQPRYNLISREIEVELLPMLISEGVGSIAYNPLAGGLLTGKHQRANAPEKNTRFGSQLVQAASGSGKTQGEIYSERYWADRNFDSVEQLRDLSARFNKSMIHLAVGWVLSNPAVTSAIIGASKASQLEENLNAAIQPLSNEELEAVSAVGI